MSSPTIERGTSVECRTALDEWVAGVAASGVRYDQANAFRGQRFLSVSVKVPGWRHAVNWPADAIRVRPS